MCWTILVSIFGTLWQWCVPLHGSCKNWMEDLKLHPIIFQKTQDLPPSLPFTIRAGLKAGLWRCVFSLLLAVEDDKHTSFHLVAARCSSYASGCWSCFCCSLCHVLFVRFFWVAGLVTSSHVNRGNVCGPGEKNHTYSTTHFDEFHSRQKFLMIHRFLQVQSTLWCPAGAKSVSASGLVQGHHSSLKSNAWQ